MKTMLDSPAKALLIGGVIAFVILLSWAIFVGVDRTGVTSFLLRWLHTLTAMIWVGLIWFVNFVQLKAVQNADAAGRAVLMTGVVPRVAASMRHAAHGTLLTGVLLLISSGYLLDRMIFTTEVYIPPLRNLMLWGGAIGGIVMWVFLQFLIWPNLKILTGDVAADDARRVKARDTVLVYARLNLALALPVTFAMVAAAHIY